MDPVTHMALGAAVGEGLLGRRIGNRAIVLGAIFGLLPDIDVLIPAGDAVDNFVAHRSWSHSLLVMALVSPLLARVLRRTKYGRRVSTARWGWFIFLVMAAQALLDSLTTYGTQLLWPLAYPFSMSSVYIVDPLYTLLIIAGVVTAFVMPRKRTKGHRWNTIGLIAGTCYLAWGISAHERANYMAQRSLSAMESRGEIVKASGVHIAPTPLNTLLWRIVVMQPYGYLEGYYSLLDGNRPVRFQKYMSDKSVLKEISKHRPVRKLKWFTKGFYGVRDTGTEIFMTDLRMGSEHAYVFSFLVASRKNGRLVPHAARYAPYPRHFGHVFKVWRRIFSRDVKLSPSAPGTGDMSNRTSPERRKKGLQKKEKPLNY